MMDMTILLLHLFKHWQHTLASLSITLEDCSGVNTYNTYWGTFISMWDDGVVCIYSSSREDKVEPL